MNICVSSMDLLLAVIVISAEGTLEEECTILMKLDSLEARVQEQEVSLREYQISIREQAVSLAEKDTRIADLEQSMTQKDTRVGDLEQSMAEKDTRIGDLEQSMTEKDTRVGDLERSMTEKDTRIGDLEQSIAELERSSTEKDTRIDELESTLNATLNLNITLLANLEQRLRPVQAVGFTVERPWASESSASKMAFQTVLTNEGGAFNASTGVFTCPSAGLYYFSAALLKEINYDGWAGCNIMRNNSFLVRALTNPGHSPQGGYYPVVNGVYTRLAVNDTVTLGGCRTPIATVFHYHSTFSGFLVTPDD